MELAQHTFCLIDAEQRWIGEVEIDHITHNLIFGAFVPGPDFPAVAEIFQKFEAAVNVQALSVVDELDAEIATLGLRLCLPDKTQCVNVYDIQIWHDGTITCRPGDSSAMLGNGLQKFSANGQPMEMAHLKSH